MNYIKNDNIVAVPLSIIPLLAFVGSATSLSREYDKTDSHPPQRRTLILFLIRTQINSSVSDLKV